MAYRVLNAARSWRFLETGALGSKVEGAAWVRDRSEDAEHTRIIDAALGFQRGDPIEPPADAAVETFVGRVERMLRQEIG